MKEVIQKWLDEATEHLIYCQGVEEESGEAMDSMERTYAEGQVDALTSVMELLNG
jgi:hypothetical protein